VKLSPRLWPVAALLALPLVLYAPFLLGGKVLYWGVYQLQFYPWRQLAVESIRAGQWPLWNPYLGAGTPLAANLQTAAFYPPNVFFLLMPVERAFGWELALHLALAGLGAYYLARTLGLSRFGALVAGLTYGGGGYLVARWVFPSMVCAAAWLPLMLALTDRLISNLQCPISNIQQHGYWILDIGLLALVIALQLLAGHAQTSFYSLLLVAALGLFRLWRLQVASNKFQVGHSLLAACYLLLAALWGVALAAIQLLPTAELAAHSQRAGTLTDLQFAYELSFWPWRFISLLAPDFFGNPARSNGWGGYWAYGAYWEEAAFVGVLPLLLAALALIAWRRKRADSDKGPLALAPFFLLISLFSILLALGDHTPLYPLLFRYAPGFGLFQAPARLLIGYALAVPLLAGLGADAFRPTSRTRLACRILLLAGLGIGIAGLAAWLALPAVRTSFGSSTARLGLTLSLAAGVLLLRCQQKTRRYFQPAACCLLLADLLAFGWGLAPAADPAVYRTPVASAEFLHAQPPGRVFVADPYAQEIYAEYVSLRSFGSSDLAYLQGLRESLLPNLNAPHRLAGVGNYDPLTVGLYRDLWDELQTTGDKLQVTSGAWPVVNLLGARYVVSGDDLDLPLIYDGEPRIYRNDAALPEAFVVHRARVVADPETRLAALLDPAFDPRVEVILSEPPPQLLAMDLNAATQTSTASVVREGPNRVVVQANAAQPGYLVLADIYYPGWQATVDGKPTDILAANHAFRAVELAAGEHTVVFEYTPLSFRAGAWITLGAALLLAATMLLSGRRARIANNGPRNG